MLPLLQTLMEREREVCLELQATHDILSDTCSRNGEQLEAEPLGICKVTVQQEDRNSSLSGRVANGRDWYRLKLKEAQNCCVGGVFWHPDCQGGR